MNLKDIRKLLKEGHSVVLFQEGETPLVVTELAQDPVPEEVPIASRWPKNRSVTDGRGDQVLERLNKEILALKAQIAQDEEGTVDFHK